MKRKDVYLEAARRMAECEGDAFSCCAIADAVGRIDDAHRSIPEIVEYLDMMGGEEPRRDLQYKIMDAEPGDDDDPLSRRRHLRVMLLLCAAYAPS